MNQDFKDLLRVFSDEKVRCLVVGGYALIKYSEPRYTRIWTYGSAPMKKTLSAYFERWLNTAHRFLRCRVRTSCARVYRIDILFDLKGLSFESAWQRRVCSIVDDVEVCFLSRVDLIINKEAVGRKQDLADVEKLRIAEIREEKD